MDSDIQNAIDTAMTVYNSGLFDDVQGKVAFLFAAAHFVVVGIQAAGGLYPFPQGSPTAGTDATQNTGSGVIGSKTAEKITIQYAGLESLIKEYPSLGAFRQTDFGSQYAMIVGPRLRCRVGITPNPSAPGIAAPAVPFL